MSDIGATGTGAGGANVRVENANGVGRVTLARPRKKNALDRQTALELRSAFVELDDDAAIRVVLLDAEGEDFCAGADLEALAAMVDEGGPAHLRDAQDLGRVFLAMRQLSKPVVCAVQGRALAGGAGLATASDVVLAHEDAYFGYPEVRVGFVPAMVMTMLRRTVGEKHAADLVLTGRVVSARDALAMGLVSRVVPRGEFRAQVDELVAGMARASATALRLTKRLFYALDDLDFREGIAAGVKTNVEARSTDDFREGVRRFAARRDRAR